MKKKILSFLFVFSMLLLAACSNDSEKKETTDKNKEETVVTIPWKLDIGPLNPHTYLPNQMTAQAMVYEGC